ncbi:MAG TPA: tetratricopeptide repeat protein [Polyangiaceae bacterium]|nr:tetratricopeptide repeat protein [Polyangiaceae bacterium]
MSPSDFEGGGGPPARAAARTPPEPAAPLAPAPAPPPSAPPPRPGALARLQGLLRDYFVGDDPTFWVAMVPLLAASALLYTRSLTTNFIFDEQEALLANPYVHGKGLGWLEAFRRDFWGLPPERSVGSYRPVPNLVWRAVWYLSERPWLHHWVNVLLHAANGALLTLVVLHATRRRGLAWLAGAVFTGCAVLTEAVSGVVGIADVLGGMGALLALLALYWPLWAMPLGVAGATLLGLFSKESALVCVPLVPYAALVLAPLTHPRRPLRLARAAAAFAAAALAFVAYVEFRKRAFPAPIDEALRHAPPPGSGLGRRAAHAFLVWFHQPALPRDPLNNPLIHADLPHRVAGALRVYWRGLTQVAVPLTLSGDYSSPQEPAPAEVVFPESVLGALALALPPLVSLGLWVRTLVARRALAAPPPPADGDASSGGYRDPAAARPAPPPDFRRRYGAMSVVAVGLMWVAISYFPHSNIPALLPTVRAERFWYFPAIGSSMVLAAFFAWLYHRTRTVLDGAPAVGLAALFFTFQGGKAYEHSTHYRDDLTFWTAARAAVPNSAKAHLNYSVMWGARGRLDIRLESNRRALELAPEWPMAHVYLGDTLCRMKRPLEAWPHYAQGFKMAQNDPNLLALGLQCLWDEVVPAPEPKPDQPRPEPGQKPEPPATTRALLRYEDELRQMADERPGSWLAYLVHDVLANGEKNNGVDPKYRPRGYNEGPKD